jgi:NAD(P)-dependent dehydrogenase (short-subunit alcohol dehydrogenase family)
MADMLRDRIAVITGGARGNGEGIAVVMSEEGATVCLLDILPSVRETAARITESGGQALGFEVDIRDEVRVMQAVEDIIAQFGKIDILVNNAGIAEVCRFVDMPTDMRERMWSTNLEGQMICSKAVLPHMIERRNGRIIMISSTTGPITVIPGETMYAATKGALLAFTKALALETAEQGITVNAILPGTVDTPMMRNTILSTGPVGDEEVKRIGDAIPLGRVASPRDIGGAAAFLASDWASYITGCDIVVDGGNRLPESGFHPI